MGRLGLGQLRSTDDKAANLAKCAALAADAVRKNVDVLSLPECFAYMSSSPGGATTAAEPLDGALMRQYQALARKHSLWLCLGGFHEAPSPTSSDKRIHNTHVILDASGAIRASYRKAHLFDADVAATSTSSTSVYRESSSTRPGAFSGAILHNTPVGTIGLTTCYDVRFPYVYSALRAAGADVVLVPSAFTLRTGEAHWEVLLRARAIENQVWVGAAAQTGTFGKRACYGHSLIVGPYGSVIEDAGEEEGVVVCAEIDLEEAKTTRKSMPVVHHRRTDLKPVEIFH